MARVWKAWCDRSEGRCFSWFAVARLQCWRCAALTLGVGIGVQGLAAGATSNCRTVYARASSVVVHVCDRIVADFEFGRQGPIVPVWDVSRRPAKKVVKYISSGYGPCNDESCDESSYRFTFLAVGKGRTSVKFRETTPSYPGQTLDSWTVKLTVLPRRKGGAGPAGPTGPTGPSGPTGAAG